MILKSQLVGAGQRLNWHSFQAYEMNAQPQSQFFEITILWRDDMVLIWNAPRPEFFVACHFSPGRWDFRTWATSRRALPWQCLTMRTRHTRLCVCRCPPTLHDLHVLVETWMIWMLSQFWPGAEDYPNELIFSRRQSDSAKRNPWISGLFTLFTSAVPYFAWFRALHFWSLLPVSSLRQWLFKGSISQT